MDPTRPSTGEPGHDTAMELLAMPSASSNDPIGDDELADYIEQLEHALGLVAAYARSEPELTLWCCRRAGELIVRCLHVHLGAGRVKKRHPTFQDLRSHPLPDGRRLGEVIGEANLLNLDTIQRQGNIGVHARRRGREEAWDGVGSATSALARVVERLFGDDLLGVGWRSNSLDRNLLYVQQGGRQEEAPQQRIDRLEARVRELVADRRDLLARMQAEATAQEAAQARAVDESRHQTRIAVESSFGRELGRLRRRAENAEAQVVMLEQTLADSAGLAPEPSADPNILSPKPTLQTPTSTTSPVAATPNRPHIAWRIARWMAVGTALGGATIAVLVGIGTWSVVQSWAQPTTQTARTETTTLAPSTRAATVSPSALAATTPPRCPDGTLKVDGASFRLRPPGDRSEWPRPARSGVVSVEVDPFCVDLAPVAQLNAEARQPCQGNPQSFDGPAPATCISRYEADAWCEQHGGGLPTIAQWETIARTDAVDELTWALDREWVADPFPPALFGMDHVTDPEHDALFRKRRLKRPDADGVRWSWNRHAGNARWTHFGFRCAYPLEDG